jgi:hypothetical protein
MYFGSDRQNNVNNVPNTVPNTEVRTSVQSIGSQGNESVSDNHGAHNNSFSSSKYCLV